MRKLVFCGLAAIFLAWNVPAQEASSKPAESRPMTPESRVAAIDEEFEAAQDAFFKEYRAAKTDEEKTQLFKERYPKPDKWFPRLYEIAKGAPRTKGAEAALLWIVKTGGRSTVSLETAAGEALEILARDHLESEGVVDATKALASNISPKAEEFLKTLEAKSPHKKVKGRALYARAEIKKTLGDTAAYFQRIKDKHEIAESEEGFQAGELARLRALDVGKNQKEVESLLEQVAAKYGDVEAAWGGTLGDRAGADLFEIRNLAVGMVAPEIQGEDIQGKPLKLSDFTGKVVLLDFWGHW